MWITEFFLVDNRIVRFMDIGFAIGILLKVTKQLTASRAFFCNKAMLSNVIFVAIVLIYA